jgi:hypothetical protein
MEVKIVKGLLSQIEKPFESSNNKITLDGLVKFLKEMDDYNTYVLFDNKDIVAYALGAFAVFLIIILIG